MVRIRAYYVICIYRVLTIESSCFLLGDSWIFHVSSVDSNVG